MNLGVRWDSIRSTFWFLPSIIVCGFVGLAVGLIWLGVMVDLGNFDRWPFLFGAGAAGARGLLSAVATSMITVAGVVFSITIVALTLASSQYTSRVLRNFMRDRVNQSVLGVFVGIFAYCLVVLRTIRGGDEGAFIPSLAVLGALLLAFVGIGYLIHFIHHIATAIQASSIVAAVSKETSAAVDALYPEPLASVHANERPVPAEAVWTDVAASQSGYVAGVDADALQSAGKKYGVMVRMDAGVGEFVVENNALASLAPQEKATAKAIAAVRAAYEVSRHRNVRTDPSFGVRQIVDIALKALSPGINDSTTAILCVDYLSAILVRLAPRRIDGLPARPAGDEACVIARGPRFETMLDEAFDQIRQNSGGNTAVLVRLADSLTSIASHAGSVARLAVLAEHADRIGVVARETIRHAWDLSPVEQALALTEFRLRERTAQLGRP